MLLLLRADGIVRDSRTPVRPSHTILDRSYVPYSELLLFVAICVHSYGLAWSGPRERKADRCVVLEQEHHTISGYCLQHQYPNFWFYRFCTVRVGEENLHCARGYSTNRQTA